MSRTQLLRHRAIRLVGHHPALFFGMVGLRKRLGRSSAIALLTHDTELVIEGFLRSANSFATRAFLNAQPRKVIVANRTHVPATIIRATQWNLPTLVLIREPRDVVVSYMMKKPFIPAADGFKDYIDYYQAIRPYRDGFVTATFDEVVANFGAVTRRVNERFGTRFVEFDHTPENEKQIFAIVERVDRSLVGNDVSRISVPVDGKDGLKHRYKAMIERADLQPLIRESEQLYEEFVAWSGNAASTYYAVRGEAG